MEAAEKIYKNYEYLAAQYADKVFNYTQMGYEYQDVLQEFKIKIYTTIKAYLAKLSDFNAGKLDKKPVPLKYYLQSACSNKVCDFIKYISREGFKMSIDEVSYDYGVVQDSRVEPENNVFVVNGVDLLENLHKKQRAVFSLYLRGYSKNMLNKVYFGCDADKQAKKQVIEAGDEPMDAMDVVKVQCEYLIENYGNDLLQVQRIFKNFNMDED